MHIFILCFRASYEWYEEMKKVIFIIWLQKSRLLPLYNCSAKRINKIGPLSRRDINCDLLAVDDSSQRLLLLCSKYIRIWMAINTFNGVSAEQTMFSWYTKVFLLILLILNLKKCVPSCPIVSINNYKAPSCVFFSLLQSTAEIKATINQNWWLFSQKAHP